MASLAETQPGTPDDYHPESATESFLYSRAIDDHESPIPVSKEVLGGKGDGLVELSRLGLPVPPGFILTTGAWCEFRDAGERIPELVEREITRQIAMLEHATGTQLGDPDKPLFVSVRSGAPVSMPGMMRTILNLGLNEQTVETLGADIGRANAWKAYLEMMIHLGVQAYGMDKTVFDTLRSESVARYGVKRLTDLPVEELQTLVSRVKDCFNEYGQEFPENPRVQIRAAIAAVFRSWDSAEATSYRRFRGIDSSMGTAAIVQQMVWGNSEKEGAGAGVMLTRNLQTYDVTPSVAYLRNKQGPAVVGERSAHREVTIEDLPLPRQTKEELETIAHVLEKHFGTPQDIEFTSDGSKLWVLQSRDVPLPPVANFRFLSELRSDGKLGEDEAIRRISIQELRSILVPPLDPEVITRKKSAGDVLCSGTPISLGNGAGLVVSSLDEARGYAGQHVILVKQMLTLSDITELLDTEKYKNVVGVVAGNGGIGSHVARIGTRVGERMPIIFNAHVLTISPHEFITVDGVSGEVFRGIVPQMVNGVGKILTPSEYETVRSWYIEKISNPWRFATNEDAYQRFLSAAQEARRKAEESYRSPKAQTQELINAMIPPEIRMTYMIVKPQEKETIRRFLSGMIDGGKDATVRTCYVPDRRGKTPWINLTTKREVDEFLDELHIRWRHGGYQSWIRDGELTELLLAGVPQGKMREDPHIQYEHGSWTLTCTDGGNLLLQVKPHNAHLRGHEDAASEDIITYTIQLDPDDPSRIRQVHVSVGDHLKDDSLAMDMASQVAQTVTAHWWESYEIPARLAAAGAVYTPPAYTVPVLEGQVRVGRDNQWCLIYGMKIDVVNQRNRPDSSSV